jgi:hypothetical protein
LRLLGDLCVKSFNVLTVPKHRYKEGVDYASLSPGRARKNHTLIFKFILFTIIDETKTHHEPSIPEALFNMKIDTVRPEDKRDAFFLQDLINKKKGS